MKQKLENFEDLCDILQKAGFSMGGGNAKGIYSVVPFTWEEQERGETESNVQWHTGDLETDPWEWRMRVLEEKEEFAYAKLFFKASGFITAEWYPRFLAVRRLGKSFEQSYADGDITHSAKRIYDFVSSTDSAEFHEIKTKCGFLPKDASLFERAIVELQTKMFITICGRARKIGKNGEFSGWSSTVFCSVEDFWNDRGYDMPILDYDESYEQIKEQILLLNPNAVEKDIKKFILG